MKVEDLKNTKIYLHFPDERVEFKDKVEKLGIRWMFSNGDNPIRQDIPFIYINEDLSLYMDYRKNFASFCSDRSRQIFLDEVLKIEEPKEEYQFKPFDKVLMRDYNNLPWLPTMYAYSREGEYCYVSISGSVFKQCIPYKGNEHLTGTTNSK